MKVKSESEVIQLCPTLSDPIDCSLPGPLSMGFPRQEYWSGVPLPSPQVITEVYPNLAWDHLSQYQEFFGRQIDPNIMELKVVWVPGICIYTNCRRF